MVFKKAATKISYRIEMKPEGGYIGISNEPQTQSFEGVTAEEVRRKIQNNLAERLAQTVDPKRYRIKKKRECGFIGIPNSHDLPLVEGNTTEEIQQKIRPALVAHFATTLPIDSRAGKVEFTLNEKTDYPILGWVLLGFFLIFGIVVYLVSHF